MQGGVASLHKVYVRQVATPIRKLTQQSFPHNGFPGEVSTSLSEDVDSVKMSRTRGSDGGTYAVLQIVLRRVLGESLRNMDDNNIPPPTKVISSVEQPPARAAWSALWSPEAAAFQTRPLARTSCTLTKLKSNSWPLLSKTMWPSEPSLEAVSLSVSRSTTSAGKQATGDCSMVGFVKASTSSNRRRDVVSETAELLESKSCMPLWGLRYMTADKICGRGTSCRPHSPRNPCRRHWRCN